MEEKLLKTLFKLANKSYKKNEFPVSAIIFDQNGIISCGYNKRNRTNQTTDHAEIIAIKKANSKLKTWRLENKCMIVTLEPCKMCEAVIREARIKKVYYLIPRYQYKKQYKCTNFITYTSDNIELDKYKEQIEKFFKDKRHK